MSEKAFRWLLLSVVALCSIATIVHFAYAVEAYQHCSIIYFIGRELW